MGSLPSIGPRTTFPILFDSTITRIIRVGEFMMVETEEGKITYIDRAGKRHLLPIKQVELRT